MARQAQLSSRIPNGFRPTMWTTVVWDNIDFCEKTVTGGGTTHFVNGILVVQSFSNNETPYTQPGQSESSVSRKIKRLSDEKVPQETIFWNKSMCTGPTIADSGLSHTPHNANIIDTSYCFMKHSHSRSDRVPAWTQFNQKIDATNLPIFKIHYLLVIESPATEMSTINTVLLRRIEIADKLDLQKIVIVCNLVVYTKVQDLRWTNETYLSRTIIRLGEFHTLMSFLGVLRKIFDDADLSGILIEADVKGRRVYRQCTERPRI